MHHDVSSAKEGHTNRNKKNQRGAQQENFHIGDYVLWPRIDSEVHVNKLAVKWIGPYRVIGAQANSFEIEHLLSGATRRVHASRLKMYADSSLDLRAFGEILEHIANQDVYFTVASFKEHRKHPAHSYEVLVAWEGLEEIEDSWEPMTTMHEDVPVKLQDYVRTADDSKLSQFLLHLQSTRRSGGNQSTKKKKAKKPAAVSKAIKNSTRRAKTGSSAAKQQKPARRLAK
ncbi:hypothetical protein PHYSODRAFT_469054 [Phytophthora sojae]|uniref:Chromo domain-containing protein n=1 Tax=Phytophthora sojae (strain P6497) TaxID=1094619 RepID=G4YEE3_PHYSP|nr:hypothetical protein PHYSODRAFT_469054 [Phytophthora sojae]EGZ26850.1 hypothetical protein PHYSODRAFT_469054 [Phytophthora sojae]|eukprot:XP_009514125.1 hypothetical protein PHYSODRAFT_469054 [Phytophthora sojae]